MARTKSGSFKIARQAEPDHPVEARRRFVCVHGHFYQPPRENPWLETVEVQDSAAPYHDWNDRITAECYAPNGASRIVDTDNQIIRIVNNYARMSFNFGPTLLSWLQDKALAIAHRHDPRCRQGQPPGVQRTRLPPWRRSTTTSSCCWHPRRLHPDPLGYCRLRAPFCPQTLKAAARRDSRQSPRPRSHGPRGHTLHHPCSVAMRPHPQDWRRSVDRDPGRHRRPSHPHTIQLDEGRSIAIFFYDGPPSRAIAFSAPQQRRRLRRAASSCHFPEQFPGESAPASSPAGVATDGESYGHHHKHVARWRSPTPCTDRGEQHARLVNLRRILSASAPVGG